MTLSLLYFYIKYIYFIITWSVTHINNVTAYKKVFALAIRKISCLVYFLFIKHIKDNCYSLSILIIIFVCNVIYLESLAFLSLIYLLFGTLGFFSVIYTYAYINYIALSFKHKYPILCYLLNCLCLIIALGLIAYLLHAFWVFILPRDLRDILVGGVDGDPANPTGTGGPGGPGGPGPGGAGPGPGPGPDPNDPNHPNQRQRRHDESPDLDPEPNNPSNDANLGDIECDFDFTPTMGRSKDNYKYKPVRNARQKAETTDEDRKAKNLYNKNRRKMIKARKEAEFVHYSPKSGGNTSTQ